MDKEIIAALDEILTISDGSTSSLIEGIPNPLRDSEYIETEFRPPTRCPFDGCREICESKRDKEGREFHTNCDIGHQDTLLIEDHVYFDISFESVLESVAAHLSRELSSFHKHTRPRYVSGKTDDGFNIYLIISPGNYQKTVNEICMETLVDDTPALLITPKKRVTDLLDIQSLFAAGNLIYTIPFTMLAEPDILLTSLDTITEIQTVEQQFLQEQNTKERNSLVFRVNSNPRYILTEFNHMRLLRVAGELPQSSGTRLEKIGEAAFSHLFVTYPDAGGEDDRGKNLPDSIFYISDQMLPDSFESILGIVDTKSGKDANFGTEPVEGKHDEYLNRGRRQSLPANKLAHVFLVLGFDGQQELDFYDRMSNHYRNNEYMVIITAEALAMIMAAYLAHTVSNDLKLVDGGFQTAIYPFFHEDQFAEVGLGEITREVGQNPDQYDTAYLQREGLIIVTREVVQQRLQDCAESPSEIQHLLSTYYRPMPTP